MCKSSEKCHANIPFFWFTTVFWVIANLIFKSYSNNLCPNQVSTSDANYQDDPGSVNKIVYTVYTQGTPMEGKGHGDGSGCTS